MNRAALPRPGWVGVFGGLGGGGSKGHLLRILLGLPQKTGTSKKIAEAGTK